ncbi:MAG: hypothetical protein LBF60_02865 [Treponema sp.]|nr:hypothetical protein [Treponema sp.]
MITNGTQSKIGSDVDTALVHSFTDYFNALRTAGLDGFGYGEGLVHNIQFGDGYHAVDGDMNANSNGLLSFLRKHIDANGVADSKIAGIGYHSSTHVHFDGSRYWNDGAAANSSARRDADGRAHPAYEGTLSVHETNYLKDTVGVKEFKNANIVGNGRDLTGIHNYAYDNITFTNISLKGTGMKKAVLTIILFLVLLLLLALRES